MNSPRSKARTSSDRDRLDRLFADSPVVLYHAKPSVDRAATFVTTNVARLFGYAPQDFLSGANFWTERIHPDDARRAPAEMSRVCTEGASESEYRFRRKDGSYLWVQDEARLVRDDEGKPVEVVGYWTDISGRKEAEEVVRQWEREREALLNGLKGVFLRRIDRNLAVVWANAAAEEFGSSSNHGSGERCRDAARQEEGVCPECMAAKAMASGEPQEGEVIGADGRVYMVRSSPVRDSAGDVVGVIQAGMDMTAHRRVEEQLRQAQKMEAVGRLAGGVAHDFRNQLTVIKGYADLLLRDGLIPPQASDMMQEIVKAAERLSRLTSQLLAFSRGEMLHPQIVNIAELVAETCKPLQRIIGEDIRLVIVSGKESCPANVDPGQFQQAIMNLASNARDAMPKGGEFSVEIHSVTLDGRYLTAHPEAKPGGYVLVKVSDTGCGMDEDVMGRIFEPFFTTKPQGEGTGLGLAMVYGFVTQSGGTIDVESSPRKGTSFFLYFPRAELPAPACADCPSAEDLPGGNETILVVEDEEPVRKILMQYLRGVGYTVLESSNTDEALLVTGQNRERINMVITDVVMPGSSGADLASFFRHVLPSVPILFVSGYPGAEIARRGVDQVLGEVMTKPFRQGDLVRTVRRMLDARRPRGSTS